MIFLFISKCSSKTSYLNKQGGGGTSANASYSSTPTKFTPTKSVQFQNPNADVDPEEEFGMSDVTLTPTVEARMNKKLVAEASTRRSSFVLSQIAKHESYFEEAGIDKNAPTLNNKFNHKFVNR